MEGRLANSVYIFSGANCYLASASAFPLQVKYPDDEDLEGAAIGLIRLQDTYHLKTADLANGYVGDESIGKELSAYDCFDIGRAAYNQKVGKAGNKCAVNCEFHAKQEYYYTLEWMNEALERNPGWELKVANQKAVECCDLNNNCRSKSWNILHTRCTSREIRRGH